MGSSNNTLLHLQMVNFGYAIWYNFCMLIYLYLKNLPNLPNEQF